MSTTGSTSGGRRVLWALIVLALASGSVEGQEAKLPQAVSSFPIFDGTLFRKKPDLSKSGLQPITILYQASFWPNGKVGQELPDRILVRRLAKQALRSHQLVVIDIEHWPLNDDDDEVSLNVQKYVQVAQWFHDAAPGLRLGYFGILPDNSYGWSLKPKGSTERLTWEKRNVVRAPIGEAVDVVFPALYTYYPDPLEWKRYAIENIKEARKYGKQVVPFLWPQYSEQNKAMSGQYVSADFWTLQLETVAAYADGVVIWGGWQQDWNEYSGWWTSTKVFLRQKAIQSQ